MARPADPTVRIELIAAAEQVFSRHGLDGARVEDITGRAGVSKGAFYSHFDSKEQLFLQIVETLLARLHHLLETKVLRAMPETESWTVQMLEERWIARDVEILEFIWANRDIVRLLLEGGKSATTAHLMDAFAARVRLVIGEFLEWCRREQLSRRDLDAELAAHFISGAYDQMARELVRRPGKPELKEWARQNQQFVMGGISDWSVIHPGNGRGRKRSS
jgi:AcrR family transcriptional regulator